MKKSQSTGKVFGFSLAEALIVLLIVTIIIAIAAPTISKRKKQLADNAAHGKWACKYINGELHSATALNVDDSLPPDNEWTKGCKFPSVAKNVKYLWVEVYGGGGGGARGYATPWVSKTYRYPIGSRAPRDGEYSIVASISNPGTAMYWKNLNKSPSNGIYYSNDENVSKVCSGFYFGEFYEQNEKKTYATCKTYTSSDVCQYTGDSTAIKRTDCISSTGKTGRYCYRYVSERPPYNYYTQQQMAKNCSAAGHKDCVMTSNSVTYVEYKQKCLNIRSLPSVNSGYKAPGISGKIYLKKGEYLTFEKDEEGRIYPEGNLSGYKHSEARDGDDYSFYHMKADVVGETMVLNKNLVATMTGGKAGIFTKSAANTSRCCTNCGNVDTYPNSSSSSVFCAKDGEKGITTITPEYSYLNETSSSSKNEMSILNQDFEYFYGCAGSDGKYSANLFPASRNNNYDIKIGKGGSAATGEDDNNVTKSAGDGEESYFGWIRAEGGQGASDYCKVSRSEQQEVNNDEESNPYGAGTGGKGGSVTFPNGKAPERNYALTIDDDKFPNSRWKVKDGENGASGMIVVSW